MLDYQEIQTTIKGNKNSLPIGYKTKKIVSLLVRIKGSNKRSPTTRTKGYQMEAAGKKVLVSRRGLKLMF